MSSYIFILSYCFEKNADNMYRTTSIIFDILSVQKCTISFV